ncbi:hypothetical protein [Hwanghaeella sp. LZ110]|uniref:hypothetical protein n=1 Tax=Hwanghaeella sp. LZ110 TaxID=3402810 RepID=UPI003B684954
MSEHDNDNTSGPRPEATLRDGRVKASIWRNEAEGGPFRSTTFARTYEDKDGNTRDAHSFSGTDLLKVSELSRQAYNKSRILDREERREAFKQQRDAESKERPRGRDDRNR